METLNKWNKKGGEKILSAWWFFVLVVIGGGIVIGVIVYYSTEINIKEVEADILAERIMSCIINNNLNEESLNGINIFEKCGLDESVFEKGSNFYFKISIGDFEIKAGDYSIEKDCKVESTITARHYPVCSEKTEIILDENGELLKLNVLTGSKQNGKKEAVI